VREPLKADDPADASLDVVIAFAKLAPIERENAS
jgi:hypothetical protein